MCCSRVSETVIAQNGSSCGPIWSWILFKDGHDRVGLNSAILVILGILFFPDSNCWIWVARQYRPPWFGGICRFGGINIADLGQRWETELGSTISSASAQLVQGKWRSRYGLWNQYFHTWALSLLYFDDKKKEIDSIPPNMFRCILHACSSVFELTWQWNPEFHII